MFEENDDGYVHAYINILVTDFVTGFKSVLFQRMRRLNGSLIRASISMLSLMRRNSFALQRPQATMFSLLTFAQREGS